MSGEPRSETTTGFIERPAFTNDEREADLNILHYDYSVVFTRQYAEWLDSVGTGGYRPFLSVSSTSPVTAGLVALLKSLAPELTPADCLLFYLAYAALRPAEVARQLRSQPG